MAKEKYIVKHFLIHDGEKFRRGSSIDLEKKDALPLIAKGIITTPQGAGVVVVVAPPPTLSASTLAKLTLAELQAQAKASGIECPEGATRDAIIALLTPPVPEPKE